MAAEVKPPFPIFTDVDGGPLENGYILVGVEGLDPVSNPQTIYWDANLTIPAANVRTSGGYPVRNGTPARLFSANPYSITVKNKNGSVVYKALSSQAFTSGVGNLQTVENISALRNLVANSAGSSVKVLGYYNEGDGGGSDRFYSIAPPGTYVDNGGSIIVPTGGNGSAAWLTTAEATTNVKIWGALGDGVTDDSLYIQKAINSIAAQDDITLYFPPGNYLVNNDLLISGKGNVRITGQNATIKIGGSLIAGENLLKVFECASFYMSDIVFDFSSNNNNVVGVYLQYVYGLVNVTNCRFDSFATNYQIGLQLERINDDPLLATYNDESAAVIHGCQFNVKNPLDNDNLYSYASPWQKGIGIKFKERAEYWHMTNCHFFGLRVGVWNSGGANGTISNCEFQQINSYIDDLNAFAAVYEDTANPTNNGKLTITGCKFNHIWYYCILDKGWDANRPYLITNNQFIANTYDPIGFAYASPTEKKHTIAGNFFQRCYNYLGLPTYPFAGNRYFIVANNTIGILIDGNIFDNNTSGGTAIVSIGGSDKIVITDSNIRYDVTAGMATLVGSNNLGGPIFDQRTTAGGTRAETFGDMYLGEVRDLLWVLQNNSGGAANVTITLPAAGTYTMDVDYTIGITNTLTSGSSLRRTSGGSIAGGSSFVVALNANEAVCMVGKIKRNT